ncbi:hypothetical protein [Desulfosporosinus shakirovi]|uniref:hypothetical protein n=1 Tax=Desulfosporosinus shakirovi TaxID=2885154 RepID=UPI001E36EA05|nr:hypothetical protein [Desulfosporosinus sp. SRJS8]MCB8818308.1 hypothetical protein [Desulfosporosinus sp. SRJS8]
MLIEFTLNLSTVPTTNGFIYLTNRISNALRYGNIPIVIRFDVSIRICIFKLKMPDNLLEPDLDEFNYLMLNDDIKLKIQNNNPPTVKDSLEFTRSVRVSQDIELNKYLLSFAELPSTLQFDDPLYKLVKKAVEDKRYSEDLQNELMKQIPWTHA